MFVRALESKFKQLKLEYGNKGLRKLGQYRNALKAKKDYVGHIFGKKDLSCVIREHQF